MNAIEEDIGIVGTEYQRKSHQILYTIDSKESRQTFVYLIKGPYHKRQ